MNIVYVSDIILATKDIVISTFLELTLTETKRLTNNNSEIR